MDKGVKTISVLGMGYMGLPIAGLLATSGFKVFGIDIDSQKIKDLKKRKINFKEPGLSEILSDAYKSKNLSFSDSIIPADVYIISVPTPIINKKADLKFVKLAGEMISKVLKKGELVMLESTVPPETTKTILIPILESSKLIAGKDFYVCHCPERAIPGNTVQEIINNNRIIGGINLKSARLGKKIYSSFVEGKIYLTDDVTAETVKLMENTFRDTNIALANEFAKIAETVNIDIWKAIKLANLHPRVQIHLPGPGVGGHCIAVDPWFLAQKYKNADLIKTARIINDSMPDLVTRMIKKAIKSIKSPKITILGLAYKPNVDDFRESPALKIVEKLQKNKIKVKSHDPLIKLGEFRHQEEFNSAIKNSDCIVIATNHDFYKTLSPKKIAKKMRNLNIIDTRYSIKPRLWEKEGFNVRMLGRGNE